MMSFLDMKTNGAKPVSNTRSTLLRPSKLCNATRANTSTASRNDGAPRMAAKLQKNPPPVKGSFKPAPRPLNDDPSPLWLKRLVMVKSNGTAAVPPAKSRPSTVSSKTSPVPATASSRAAPAYISPELRSADHPSSRARASDLPSSGPRTRHDNAKSDSAAVMLQSQPRVKTLREVGTLGAPKADGRMVGRVKRYVPDTVSTVTSAYDVGDNWVSLMNKCQELSLVMDGHGSDVDSDYLPSFLKLESYSGDSGTLVTRASSGVLPAGGMAVTCSKPKNKTTVMTFNPLDCPSQSAAENKHKSGLPAQDPSSGERRPRPSKVLATLTPDDSISNFGDKAPHATPCSARPPARTTKSYEEEDENVAFRTYTSLNGSLRQPAGKGTGAAALRDKSVPYILRTPASEEELRSQRDRPSSKTATPISNSQDHSSRRVTSTVSSLADSAASSLTSGLTPRASAFPAAPQSDGATIIKFVLERYRRWLPQLGMANVDLNALYKDRRKEVLKNCATSDQHASLLALMAVTDIVDAAVQALSEAKSRRVVPPSPRSSSSNSKGNATPCSSGK